MRFKPAALIVAATAPIAFAPLVTSPLASADPDPCGPGGSMHGACPPPGMVGHGGPFHINLDGKDVPVPTSSGSACSFGNGPDYSAFKPGVQVVLSLRDTGDYRATIDPSGQVTFVQIEQYVYDPANTTHQQPAFTNGDAAATVSGKSYHITGHVGQARKTVNAGQVVVQQTAHPFVFDVTCL